MSSPYTLDDVKYRQVIDAKAMHEIKDFAEKLFHESRGTRDWEYFILGGLELYLRKKQVEPGFEVRLG